MRDTGWHIPKVSGAKGCGGAYEEYVDKALNVALQVEYAGGYELGWKTGIVVLEGDLHDGQVAASIEKSRRRQGLRNE